jgi:hypothetical protein
VGWVVLEPSVRGGLYLEKVNGVWGEGLRVAAGFGSSGSFPFDKLRVRMSVKTCDGNGNDNGQATAKASADEAWAERF